VAHNTQQQLLLRIVTMAVVIQNHRRTGNNRLRHSRRRILIQCAVGIVIIGMGVSTLLIHHRGITWAERLKDNSDFMTTHADNSSGGYTYQDHPSFEMPPQPASLSSQEQKVVVTVQSSSSSSSATESSLPTMMPVMGTETTIMMMKLVNNDHNDDHNITVTATTKPNTNIFHPTQYNSNISLSSSSSKTFAADTKTSLQQNTTTASFMSLSMIQEKCFPYNSDRWIQGTKDSNYDQGLTPELIETLLEGPRQFQKLSTLFQQTICHPNSPLKNLQQQQQQQPDSIHTTSSPFDLEQRSEEWYQRFFYLALHWKFHQPAIKEYQARKDCWEDITAHKPPKLLQLQAFQTKHGIGNWDFECRESKFVISPVGHIGFGAFINTQVCLTILIAIRTGRIPIFTIQSLYPWQKGETDPWLLAPTHCQRKDLQCYFMSMTPCALLIDDIRNATRYGITRNEQRWLKDNMDIPEGMKHERVVVINSGLQSKGIETIEIRSIAASIVEELLEEWMEQQKNESNQQFWSKEEWQAITLAKQWMVEKAKDDPTGLLRQMYVYFLRPNPYYQNVLDDRMSALLPTNLNPSTTVGVAIRGSDKCQKESTCLEFPKYMDLVTEVVYPNLEQSVDDKTKPKLILTTEDPTIFNESLPYQQNASFQYQFLVNDQDNMQGSGFPKDFRDQGENTIVSTLTALMLHLSAGQVFLNCCSNSHNVIAKLIVGQCGANRHGNAFAYHNNHHFSNGTTVPIVVARCLNEENAVPRKYRICCGWYSKKDSTCNEIWQEHLQNRKKSEKEIL
jgi:hypothetical protein